jgi:predicted ATPase
LAVIVGKLLERDLELARVAAALADGARVLVVEGEAGIGKSAVLAAGLEGASSAVSSASYLPAC